MFEVIQQSESVAVRRRIYFSLVTAATHTAGATASLTGVKALSAKNGTIFTPAADMAYVDSATRPGLAYQEYSQAEVDTVGQITGYVAVTGCDPVWLQAAVVAYDPYADGAAASTVAALILATPANKLATASDGSVQLSATDEANIASVASKVDATVSSRASAASLAAGVTLTSGERSATTAALLGAVIETNGGVTMTVRQALQAGASLTLGAISGITDGTGTEIVTVRSATGQVLATFPTDGVGNRAAPTITWPS